MANARESEAAANAPTVSTLMFKTLYVLVFIAHGRRELVHVNVTANPTAAWVWREVIEATPWANKPRHLLRDRDSVYGRDFRLRAQRIGVDAIATPVRAPRAHAVVIDFRHGDVANMPFPADSFDFVVCQAAFKNFPDPVAALDEIHCVLRPGARASIFDLRKDAPRDAIDREVLGRILLGPLAGRLPLHTLSAGVPALQPVAILVLLLVPFVRGRVWHTRSGRPAEGGAVSLRAAVGAELGRVHTDTNGVFEWRHPYVVLTYFVWPRARGVQEEITTWWPAAAFHAKQLYVPYAVRDATRGEDLGVQVGECWSCVTWDECGRAYPFRLEEHAGITYHIHYLDLPPEPRKRPGSLLIEACALS